MQRIKNEPKKYLRRDDIGFDASSVTESRSRRNRSKKDFLNALIEPSFYASFIPRKKYGRLTKRAR